MQVTSAFAEDKVESRSVPSSPPRLVQRLLETLVELRIDPREALARSTTTRARVNELVWPTYAFWDALASTTNECGIGIRLAENVRPADFGLMGQLVSNSGTLVEALFHGVRLARLNLRGARISVMADGENTCVSIGVARPGTVHPEELDFVIASGVIAARMLTGTDITPGELFFPYDAPRDTSHHRRVFRAPLRFGAAQAGCTFQTTALLQPLPNSNAAMRSTLARKADERIAASSAELPQQVRSAILAELRGGNANIRRVAARLGTYPHMLTRRLRVVGLNYRELLAKTRLELAEEQLQRSGARVGRISDALGYSNRSAFNRAFKRATGYAPLEYRERMRMESSEEDQEPADVAEDDA